MFKNRIEAADQLAEVLESYNEDDLLILAIPRGGLPLGARIAEKLNAAMDVILTKKIGHPSNKEYAIGALSLESYFIDDRLGVSQQYIMDEVVRLRAILKEKYQLYYRQCQPISIKNRRVIIVDDGIATGNTMVATIALAANEQPKDIIVAVPVAPIESLRKISSSAFVLKCICLKTPTDFHSVGQYYEDFSTVSDSEAVLLLERSRGRKSKINDKN